MQYCSYTRHGTEVVQMNVFEYQKTVKHTIKDITVISVDSYTCIVMQINNAMHLETLFIVQLYHIVRILLLPRSLDSISVPH